MIGEPFVGMSSRWSSRTHVAWHGWDQYSDRSDETLPNGEPRWSGDVAPLRKPRRRVAHEWSDYIDDLRLEMALENFQPPLPPVIRHVPAELDEIHSRVRYARARARVRERAQRKAPPLERVTGYLIDPVQSRLPRGWRSLS